jgi:hypothetical protein
MKQNGNMIEAGKGKKGRAGIPFHSTDSMIAGEKVKQGLIPLKIKQVRPQQNRMQNRVRMHFARKLSSGVTSWPRIPLPKVKKKEKGHKYLHELPFLSSSSMHPCSHAG